MQRYEKKYQGGKNRSQKNDHPEGDRLREEPEKNGLVKNYLSILYMVSPATLHSRI